MKRIFFTLAVALIFPLLFFSACLFPVCRHRLFLVSDGIATNVKTDSLSYQRGWGTYFPLFLKSKLSFENVSCADASTRSFLSDSLWNKIIDSAKYNDFIFIQLGQNDMDVEDTLKYSNINDFDSNLMVMVNQALDKRYRCYLLTPVPRYSYHDQTYYNSHGAYIDAIKLVAKRMQVPLIDVHQIILDSFSNMEFDSLYNFYASGRNSTLNKLPNNVNFYLNDYGAFQVAKIIAESIKKMPHLRHYVIYNDTISPNDSLSHFSLSK